MKPLPASAVWFESTPALLDEDPDGVLLMVRVGMALNALTAQARFGMLIDQPTDPPTAHHFRMVILSVATGAALLREAIRLAHENIVALGGFAERVGIDDDVNKKVRQLCGGAHVASSLLARARNKVVFHWDRDAIGPVLARQARNEPLVWMEGDPRDFVQRLALDVLMHALFPDATPVAEDAVPPEIQAMLDGLVDANEALATFFAAALAGYASANGIQSRSRR